MLDPVAAWPWQWVAAVALAAVAAAAAAWWLRGFLTRRAAGAAAGDRTAGDPAAVPLPTMLESALAATPIGIAFADRDLRFVRVNDALAQFTGRPPEAHIGRPVRELLPPGIAAAIEPTLRRVLATGETVLGVELRGESTEREGGRHYLANVYPVRGPRGRPEWVGALISDVTAERRRRAERDRLVAALRESEARFRALAESGVIGVLVANPERVLEANDAFLQLIGYTRDEMHTGRIRWTDILAPEYAERDEAALRELLATGVCRPFEKEYIRKDGVRVPILIGGAVTEREPLEWACFVMDIGERKRTEAELRESERRYRSLFDRNPTPMWVYDFETLRFVDVNPAAVAHYGWSRAEFLAMTIRDVRPPDEHAYLTDALRSRGPGITVGGRFRHWKKDGTPIEVDITSQELIFGDRRSRLVLATDVSARVRAEEDVQKFVSLVESSGDCIAMATLDWRLFYLNRAGRALAGLGAERPAGDAHLGELWDEPTRLALETEVLPAVAAGERREFEGRLRHAASGELSEVDCSAFGIRDARTGRVLAAAFVVRDRTEQRRIGEHLRQAQRMEAIGRVAGGVAHEVNNMMTVILGFCTFLEHGLEAPDQRADDVAQIARAAERAAEVSRSLLAYSRRQLLQPQVLDLSAVLLDMESVLRRLMGEDRQCLFQLSPQIGLVQTDRAQLEQVLLNLALNARDAMPRGGRFSLETSTVVLGADYAHRHPGTEVRPGPYVRLAMSDTGHGMDAATQAQAFEPFFTTKPVGQGSGLGLSTAYGIVKQSGGYIWLYSEPGQGTTLKVYLPQVAESGAPVTWVAAPAPPRGQGEVVLVVEDEDVVRDFACRFLQGQGYATREAADGVAALALVGSAPDTIDLVLCDVVMPRMGGPELAGRLAILEPGLPVLFTSGYTDDEIARRGLLAAGAPFLQKPFSPETLARRVREVLDAPTARRAPRRASAPGRAPGDRTAHRESSA
ncbi:MAG TPA: PAS domain S-box protein [Gemmatimonadales bacterium]|nr:PAS domain S-box protein [Gemmatimonadales bacterium]